MQNGKPKRADKDNRRELFSVIGQVKIVDGRKRFVPNSPKHLNSALARIPLNKVVACTFSEHVPTRSRNQLAYHWVLLGYLSEYTGHDKKELHDYIMRVVFGETVIVLGGIKRSVRKSVADDAKMPKAMMSKLIESDVALCRKLDITIPTAKELGYTSNDVQYIDADYGIENYPEYDGKTAFDD